jgi:tRNA-dihydrouridine synthase A
MESLTIDYSEHALKNYHKISIAPMLGHTNTHFRNLTRLLTKETTLYTEMIHHDTIINHKNGYEGVIGINQKENPIVIQLGGNNIEVLSKVAPLCRQFGYDEINLNCGCPSSKVVSHNFGACLMRNPDLVAACCKKLREESHLETTVKCRLGLDKFDNDFLFNFIDKVNEKGGVNHFILHARLAMMDLDTDKNRKIPPLQYDKVNNLCDIFSDRKIVFSLNGGLKDRGEIKNILNENKIKGCMIGRHVLENPWSMATYDSNFYSKKDQNLTRKEVIYRYAEYCDEVLNKEKVFYKDLIKPLINLFYDKRRNSVFKELLLNFNKTIKPEEFSDHLKFVIEEFEKHNSDAVNELPNNI